MAGEDGVRPVGREDLPAAIAFADRLIARDLDGRAVALPGALGGDRDRRPEDVDHMSRLHTRDRPQNARAWVNAINDPGGVYSVDAWVRVGDGWAYRRFDYCNLIDQPRIGVVLVGVTALEPAVASPPPQSTAMEHEPARWSILRIGPLGRIQRAEGTVVDLYGRTADELVGMNGLDLVHPDDHERLLDAWADVVEGGSPGRALRQRVVSDGGAVTWVLASIGRPEPDGSVTIHDLDISAQLAAEEALRTSEERFRNLASELPVGVFVCDPDGWFEFTNEACRELLGGANCFDEFLDPARTKWTAVVRDAAEHGEVSIDCPTEDGRLLRIRCQAPLPDGTVSGVIEDVTSSTRWREEASRDALTGLTNRSSLSREITRRITVGEHSLVAFIDLDSFKRVNDLHGHDEGDRVLVRVSEALRGMIRDGDIAGRWGGDEFVLLMGDLPPDAQSDLRRRVDASMATCGAGGASVGFTALQADDDVRAVISRADRAMYADKRRATTDASGR
ncbi:sensor domain-containing diguanylate cyclase [Actinospongicola halichondriae]|uniref:sensor domain-containing diguanylate cyclase n=1 Tax=Actinospongicola halichondriae TaxID=3236844 RepID=UPI003D48B8BF